MKKIIGALMIMAISIAIIGCSFKGIEKSYDTVMAVVDVDAESNIITLATFTDYEYFYEDNAEEWLEGDICTVEMLDNHTETIEDDKIHSVGYSGWVDHWGFDYSSAEPLYFFE